MEFEWITAWMLFVVYVAIDFLYGYYTKKVVESRPFLAAHAATGIALMAAFGVLSYTENPLYIVPIAAGSWVGTYISVKYT